MAFRNMRVWRYLEEVVKAGSVRHAAERLYVTPSALLRRIQDIEFDLGTPLFERNASGVQLTAAGELFIGWVRTQNAELQRVCSQIEELSGLRRGEIRIHVSQAAARSLLLEEINRFRAQHPLVKFKVTVSDHDTAMRAMTQYETDLILVFRPVHAAELQPLMSIGQGMVAVMAHDHPLAEKAVLRLRECLQYDIALPDTSFSGRQVIDEVLSRGTARVNPVMEANSFELLSDFVRHSNALTFQIDIGARLWRDDPTLAVRPLDNVDSAHGPLVLGQLRGRNLPVAAAKFAEQLARRLDDMRSLPLAGGDGEAPRGKPDAGDDDAGDAPVPLLRTA
ncbi:LysR family transcriptional regulator [Azoarcus sp. TTM-91]|uniref:LysR family transcriptional regulator n=1 Tax=Azoarcus sp. TTM-91 TaxID=2691581 RepID=UPI001B7CDB94|nr:LysR family transcriptional regulator [Azoarcus sp. TTM-91]